MELNIKVSNFHTGEEMEKNLNKVIKDLGETLIKKGFMEMELIGVDFDNDKEIYRVTLNR